MLKLLPPHGWRAVGWELGIVTLGVLIALGAQQVVEESNWRSRADQATDTLRQEVAGHYLASVEAVKAQPCIDRQLAILDEGLRKSSRRPAKIYSDAVDSRFTLRTPSRPWSENKWSSIVSEGVASHLPKDLRDNLGDHYAQVTMMRENNRAADQLGWSLNVLGGDLPFDAATRVRLSLEIAQAKGRFAYMKLVGNQVISRVQEMKLTPLAADIAGAIRASGTLNFCRAQGLPIGEVGQH